MKTIRMLSFASVLAFGAATAGIAATNTDSAGAPMSGPTAGTATGPTTTTTQPGMNAPATGSSQYGQAAPYATGAQSPGNPVGPSGSMKRDAANPQGYGKGGGENGTSSGGTGGNSTGR